MNCKYIQNVHTNSIKAHFADKKEVIFRPDTVDHFSGRQLYTGYTRLANDDYDKLLKESALFRHFIEMKKLVVHDDLPPDAQTPHEALVSARKDVGKLNAELDKAIKEKEALQAKINELDRRYKELLGADGDERFVKAQTALSDAQARIQTLTVENEKAKKDFDGMKKSLEALKVEHEKLLKARK
jgi:chaperonin cofactor prefoldin